MASDLVAILTNFAQGQVKTMGDRGWLYLERCYALWTEKYGTDVVLKIKHAVGVKG